MSIVEERLKWDERIVYGLAGWMQRHVQLTVFIMSVTALAVVALIFGG